MYDLLKLAQGQKKGGFKVDPKTHKYYLPEGFELNGDIFNNLYLHQKEGLKWLYELYRKRMGGVLGDDMGLGKTVQICAYLQGLFKREMIKKVLIVVPASLKNYW